MSALRNTSTQFSDKLKSQYLRKSVGLSRRSSSSASNHGHHTAPRNEPLGKQLYITLALFPLSIGIYTLSRPDANGKPSTITRYIDSFSHYNEEWSKRNLLHTKAIEQAAYDRNLFHGSSPPKKVINLRFPEYARLVLVATFHDILTTTRIFNTGSPFNVVAGQGPQDMDVLVAHYTSLNAEEEKRKRKVMASRASET
ncbi:Bgt-3372 [Blumeria graminis f. sp. tritici]|uniref:NADH-ubiquinone oxidoreductase n=3 Tax=Blumeria graminis f. sp. tritici TaxID=62690 RepID=A0A656KQT7_BLUGR|nr:NADH-ubiquinone oxidoreductase [Blumeria graminis f. sp. tritici 96224]VDB93544.1 Bgt-3372 [Blumeria graminis f. sp. tritici]